MRLQNRFRTGLDIARTPPIMRADMAAYDADPAKYTQSLGCWHGFIGQQKLISIKKHFGTTKQALPLPLGLDGRRAAQRVRPAARPVDAREDQRAGADRGTLHLPAQADARELGMMFRDLDAARAAGDE
jgi:isocitrate lyase